MLETFQSPLATIKHRKGKSSLCLSVQPLLDSTARQQLVWLPFSMGSTFNMRLC